MTTYICYVWDGIAQETVLIGAFSSLARAMEEGSLYLIGVSNSIKLVDWSNDDRSYYDWYMDDNGNAFSRVIHKTKVDEKLV